MMVNVTLPCNMLVTFLVVPQVVLQENLELSLFWLKRHFFYRATKLASCNVSLEIDGQVFEELAETF